MRSIIELCSAPSMLLYPFEKEKEGACGSCGKARSVRFSKDLVGAFCASTGPAASTRARDSYGMKIGRLGPVDGSAFKAQHAQCLAETCAPSTVVRCAHPVGSRAVSASTRAMPRCGR